jgi:protein TonB
MLELKPRSTAASPEDRAARKARQSQRLLFALLLLLVAIVIVVVTDRQFWFGSNQLILDGDESQPAVAPAVTSAPSAAQHSQAVPQKKHVSAANSAAQKSASPVVAVNRTVLPPLNVEVVAGANRLIHPNTKIEIANAAPASSAVTDAAGRERIQSKAAPQASYPLLAQHMNVQGSVVLKAVIGADGIISDLHIVSGPAILAAAAQQAVREWHFKPVLQNGQPVETMAKIVVNFSIKVADDSEKTTVAESRANDLLIFTR